MTTDEFTHRCADAECCYLGQPTSPTCRCHRTREQMMLATIAEMRTTRSTAPTSEGLREALAALTEHYVRLVKTGDAGFWNPEKEPVVIAARQALAQAPSPASDAVAHLPDEDGMGGR